MNLLALLIDSVNKAMRSLAFATRFFPFPAVVWSTSGGTMNSPIPSSMEALMCAADRAGERLIC